MNTICSHAVERSIRRRIAGPRKICTPSWRSSAARPANPAVTTVTSLPALTSRRARLALALPGAGADRRILTVDEEYSHAASKKRGLVSAYAHGQDQALGRRARLSRMAARVHEWTAETPRTVLPAEPGSERGNRRASVPACIDRAWVGPPAGSRRRSPR